MLLWSPTTHAAVCYCSLSDDDVVAKFLTVDHNGRNKEEAQRIAKQHGKMARSVMLDCFNLVCDPVWLLLNVSKFHDNEVGHLARMRCRLVTILLVAYVLYMLDKCACRHVQV